ncbi:MAG: PKD domain-containing protein [Bacteroidales bacterium]|nr:PKD domain-containing protein [Bacteroidales bacterium]
MKIKLTTVFLMIIALGSFTILSAQQIHPEKITKAAHFDISRPLGQVDPIPMGVRKRDWKEKVVPNKLHLTNELENTPLPTGPDPVLQNSTRQFSGTPQVNQNFSGITNTYGVAPPDTDGDVGPNHYLQMVNNGFAIWDKEGNLLYGPADNITLWDGFPGPWSSTNDGDPVVLYDEYSDRWIATQFSLPNYPNGPFYELVAVSETGDPLGAWYRYAFEFDAMPDYPKFGVWPDGYYFTTNLFSNGGFSGGGISILDRSAMLTGDPDAQMIFFVIGYNWSNHSSFLPADADGALPPPADSPSYMVNMGNNVLRVYKVDVDWVNTANSFIEQLSTLSTAPFSTNGLNIQQPGTSQTLSTLAGRLMYRLQYRNFGDYQVMLTNHTVNAGNGKAGVRWYELRNYGTGWEIYQQGTFAPADGDNRWMASVAMNQGGDIAVGYSVSGANTYPSIRVAGQSAGAPAGLGVLDIDEVSIYEGTQSQSGVDRWGDYSAMAVDPTDGMSFWYTTEYSNGGWGWRSQIASVSFASQPICDFTSDETIVPVGETVSFTDLTQGIPTHWTWTFEGATPSTSSDESPQNILYDTEGVYPVKLVAYNTIGIDSVTKETYITVNSTILPLVDFEADKKAVCLGETVQFTDMTQFSPVAWNWEFVPNDVTFVNGSDANSQNPEVVFNNTGSYQVTLTADNLNGSSTLLKDDVIKAGGNTPYFLEDFETDGLKANEWTVENPDGSITWEMYETGGTTPGNHSVGINFREYISVSQRDYLVSPPFNLTGTSTPSLEFQYAYAQYYAEASDSLIISVSTDCGITWNRIYANAENGSGNFATHELTTNDWWPAIPSDWCMEGWGASCVTLDLTAFAGNDQVRIRFETYSFLGHPLFLDNIAVSSLVGTQENDAQSSKIRVFPNPTNGDFHIRVPEGNQYDKIEVMNNMGQLVKEIPLSIHAENLVIKRENFWIPGVYYLRGIGRNTSETIKLIIY